MRDDGALIAVAGSDESLGRLLHPYTTEEFFSSVWETKPLHVSRSENPDLEHWYTELVGLDDVDRLLTTTYAAEPRRSDAIRMGRDGVMISPDEYLSRRNGVLAEVDVTRVLALHRNGASIIVNGVDATLEPVGELCRAISRCLGVRVHANVYLTPREAQGFPLHFDPHDVFLLQIAGHKDWTLYPSPVPLAVTQALDPRQLEPQGLPTRLCLRSGELLYIPRGLLHEGMTSDDLSVHVTIGMNPYTWSELLRDLVTELEGEDVELRRSVPLWLASLGDESDGKLEHSLSRLTDLLHDSRRASSIARRKAGEFRGTSRVPLRGLLTQIHEPERIRLDTVVRLREHLRPEIEREGSEVVVRLPGGGKLTLPAFAEAHVSALCEGSPTCAEDLPHTLDDEGKLVLVRRLVREGLLVRIS